jgi:hypothetical protein
MYSYSEPSLVLANEFHLSYPFVFEDNGSIYMLPENSKSDNLELYICENFPTQWVKYKTLLSGSFVDTVILKYNSLYWLFTTKKTKNQYVQEQIYYSESLEGEWISHTVNFPKIKSSKGIYKRNGGDIVKINNSIYRFVQSNINFYGEGIDIFEIVISKYNYVEKLIHKINKNVHHLCIRDGWVVFDSNNRNNNFYELCFTQITKRWNERPNRQVMLQMYEQIGNYLRNSINKNVLDIGFEVFNIYNYSYFNNYDINYYQIDIRYNEEYIKKIPFEKFIFQDLLSYDKFDFYNVVISFGVFGYIEFTSEQIDNYLIHILI